MRVALATIVLLAALGAGQATANTTPPGTQLRVTFWSDGQPGPARTWTLSCRPAAGTHPTRGRACLRLGTQSQPFRPVPKDAMCTQVYGGPQEALITGRHGGRTVWARFNLRDGCQIARWERLVPLLPAAGAA